MDPTERRAHISEEAAEWWVRLRADDLPREERAQFVDWLRESPVHVAEMLRIAQVHGALEGFTRWARIATDASIDDTNVVPLDGLATRGSDSALDETSSRDAVERPRTRLWLGGLAAGLAAIAIAVAWVLFDLAAHTIRTERGERREVALADGSVLLVSPESKLRVRLDEGARRITLINGSTLFRVAKDPRRPFIVQADDTLVRAVGTAFGVERRAQAVVVTVSEGKVQVESKGASPWLTSPDAPPLERLTLTAGEQISVAPARAKGDASAQRISPDSVRKVDTARALAWAEGRLVFESDSIAEVIAEFNRYNRVQLHVTDEALARRTVSGVFDASDPESFIAFVETVAPVRIERDEDRNITLASP